MPIVWRQDGFKFQIYTNDHNPSHVHVKKAGGGEVVIYLGDEETKPVGRENRGMTFKDYVKALRIAAEQQKRLTESWRRIHG